MEGAAARKVMVVADPTRESASALQYALSHALEENDTLFLFHVGNNPNAWKINNPFGAFFKKPMNNNGGGGAVASSSFPATSAVAVDGSAGEVNFLDAMKQACAAAQPKLKVVVVKAEMAEVKDKASLILAESVAYKIDLIIVGHRRSLSNAILGTRRGALRGLDTADYLILNSKCTCVAVQKKGQNAGYLLSSRTHKNFWLLA